MRKWDVVTRLRLVRKCFARGDRATRSHVSVSTSIGSCYTHLQKVFVACMTIVDFSDEMRYGDHDLIMMILPDGDFYWSAEYHQVDC